LRPLGGKRRWSARRTCAPTLRLSQRTTMSEEPIGDRRGESFRRGIPIGVWDESDVAAQLWSQYLGEGQ